MPPKKAIAKSKCKSKKTTNAETLSSKGKLHTSKGNPPENAVLVDAKVHAAIVILPDGMCASSTENEVRTFCFDDAGETILFRGYALPDTKLDTLQKAVGGFIEYAPGKTCPSLRKAGFNVMACNEEGRFKFAGMFNADAWAFAATHVELFGPVVLMKKME